MNQNLETAVNDAARQYGMDNGTTDLFGRYLGALHAYDPFTCAHCLRVGELCGRIAGLDGHDAGTLYLMGALHDIGKLAVPRELLNKNGVTSEEYTTIKTHTRAGYTLLQHNLPWAACAAGKHHPGYAVPEYPSGFTGEQCRTADHYTSIVTLADFYDALMTRNNTRFTGALDRTDPAAVTGFLGKHFPGRENDIGRYFQAGIMQAKPQA
jgi:HD-GYP domain-containing protein (c-di-GMP phosphodiesterase class II)